MATLSGRIVAGYLIQEEIGRGGMGVVFKAQQLSVDRPVAIKFLSARVAGDPRIVARFLREAKAAGQLAHPNVVAIHDAGQSEGMHYIAMQLIEGPSVQKRIREDGPLNEKETLAVAAQIADALRFAHGRGILHRDVKPDNFLIDQRGHVWLADLGLARFVAGRGNGAELTQDGSTLGTPQYMSPEQCIGSGVDARSDLYSLGASMYMMSTGKATFDGHGAGAVITRVLSETPKPLREINPKLSPAFAALVEKLMAKDPAHRFADAAAVLAAIERCKLAPGIAPPSNTGKGGSAAAGLRLKPALIGGICAIVFLIIIGSRQRNGAERQKPEKPPQPISAEQPREPVKAPELPESAEPKKALPPTREELARGLFDEAVDARQKKDRTLLNSKINALSIEYADTEFVKSHRREIEELPTK